MTLHNNLGKEGETIPSEFLQKKGYKILDCNWRHSRYEVDIVAQHNGFLVFIEVKTRSTFKFGFPDESVDFRKEKCSLKLPKYTLNKKTYSTKLDLILSLL